MADRAASEAEGLLPCPFCGAAASFCADDSYGGCHVLCSAGCNAEPCTSAAIDQPQIAIAAWNTRPTPTTTGADEVERLREAALTDGETFLRKANSAWACGEPPHRVRDMLAAADAFERSLASLRSTDAVRREVGP